MRFCYSRLQTRVAGLSHDIEQLSRSVNSEDSTTQIRGCSDPFSFSVHFMKPSSRCTLVRILPTSSSKSAMRHCGCQFFNILKYECKSSFRHSPVPFLSTVFPHWGAEPRKCRNRDSTSATPEATLPEKNQSVSRTKAFHRWTHTLPTLLLFSAASTRELLLLTMFLPWWQDYRTAPGHSSRVTRKFSN